MAKDPAVLFYTNDFLAGVSDLTFEERGQYITLLCLHHQKGRLSKKAIDLGVPNVSNDVLSKFKIDVDGNYYNERLEFEAEKRRKHAEHQRDKAKKRWEQKQLEQCQTDATATATVYAAAYATAMPLENENESINSIDIDINNNISPKNLRENQFEQFWELYDNKKGKAKAKAKFLRLSDTEAEKALQTVEAYVKATPDIKYRKYPETWLNGKCWDDEIKISEPNKQTKKPEVMVNERTAEIEKLEKELFETRQIKVDWDIFLSFFNEKARRNVPFISDTVKIQVLDTLKYLTKEHLMDTIINCSKEQYFKDNASLLTLEFVTQKENVYKYGSYKYQEKRLAHTQGAL